MQHHAAPPRVTRHATPRRTPPHATPHGAHPHALHTTSVTQGDGLFSTTAPECNFRLLARHGSVDMNLPHGDCAVFVMALPVGLMGTTAEQRQAAVAVLQSRGVLNSDEQLVVVVRRWEGDAEKAARMAGAIAMYRVAHLAATQQLTDECVGMWMWMCVCGCVCVDVCVCV